MCVNGCGHGSCLWTWTASECVYLCMSVFNCVVVWFMHMCGSFCGVCGGFCESFLCVCVALGILLYVFVWDSVSISLGICLWSLGFHAFGVCFFPMG